MKNALTLKKTYDAITIRNYILLNFEQIISAPETEKESLLNIVIVGAGPTGVELAGAFAEIKKNILPKDYPSIDFSKVNVILSVRNKLIIFISWAWNYFTKDTSLRLILSQKNNI